MKKRVILLGAISSFCDLVREIVKLDLEPIICDYYPDAPAKKMGYASYDISTIDESAVLELAKSKRVDGIISAYSDRNLLPAFHACGDMGLKRLFSENIIRCLTDKKNMKSFFVEHGYPVVRYGLVDLDEIDRIEEEYSFPVIVKPIDSYGSKGIFLCDSVCKIRDIAGKTIKESVKYDRKFLVEEFYESDEISISAWVKHGKAYITCVYDVVRNYEGALLLAVVSFPSKYSARELPRFTQLVNRIISDIGIEEGPVTLQCFIGKDGIKVSELLCRLAGGSPYLYPTYFGGPNLARMVVQYAVGETIDYQNLECFEPVLHDDEVFFDIQVMIVNNKGGKIRYSFDANKIKKEVKEVQDIIVYYPDQAEIGNANKSGVIFAKVICMTHRKLVYENVGYYRELIKELDRRIKVLDSEGTKISIIREPEQLDVINLYEIDWAFLGR